MKKILLENDNNKDNRENYTELFGLSRAGKTSYLKSLIKKGHKGVLSTELTRRKKIILFIKYMVFHLKNTLSLFLILNMNQIKNIDIPLNKRFRIELLRNSYLFSVLAKRAYLINPAQHYFIDEYLTQSLFIFLQNKSTEYEIKQLLRILSPKGKILMIESPRNERYSRIEKTRLPAQQISLTYARKWMENSEYNYLIIKQILLTEYGPINKKLGF
jgi:hypothetical protein